MEKSKIKNIALEWAVIMLLGICLSCTSVEGKHNDKVIIEEAVENTIVEETSPNQEEDLGELSWNEFKTAIKTKDEELLQRCCTSKITDYEGLFFMLNELYVLRKMDETQFKDLEVVVYEGTSYMEFYAEDIGEDEFGYEYGTSITLHFLLVEGSLFLDQYLAAG